MSAYLTGIPSIKVYVEGTVEFLPRNKSDRDESDSRSRYSFFPFTNRRPQLFRKVIL